MARFRKSFEALAALVSGILDEVLESTFINGLKLEIWAEVRLLWPIVLAQLMETAQRVEDKNIITQASKENPAQKNAKMGFNPIYSTNSREGEEFPTRTMTVGKPPNAPKREFTS